MTATGMPGAFTSTCSEQHLPGFVAAAPQLQSYGFEDIAVVTTNDRFVNEAWAAGYEGMSSRIRLLCDGDGDAVRKLGLAADQGFGVGVRAKRFVMVLEDGKVQHVLTDDGMDTCENTSAARVLELVKPVEVAASGESGGGAAVIGGVAAIALAAAAFVFSSGGDAPPTTSKAPPPTPAPEPVNRSVEAPKPKPSGTSFNLLKEYL